MRRWSEAEKSEIWDRFEAGESQRSISRRLGRSPSIRTHLLGWALAAACAEVVDEGEDGALFVIAERFAVVFDPVGTG